MSSPRISINMHLSGTVTLTDFAKIAALIEPDEFSVQRASHVAMLAEDEPVDPVKVEAATPDATPASDPNEIDAHGHPWSAEIHAGSKGKTKDGLWRMKVGATRPAPMPGFPKTDETTSSTSTPSQASPAVDGATAQAGSSQTEAPTSAVASPADEEDEFAAFTAAAAAVKADANAAAAVPPRVYTDADLGAVCNQAAVKMGDPAPIKEIIAQYVPAGEVAHSRNVPADKRADFVKAVETKAGIEFAG